MDHSARAVELAGKISAGARAVTVRLVDRWALNPTDPELVAELLELVLAELAPQDAPESLLGEVLHAVSNKIQIALFHFGLNNREIVGKNLVSAAKLIQKAKRLSARLGD